jgi:hypothetical protein
MENRKSFAIDSPVRQNEPPVPIGCHIQPSEPIGEKNWITNLVLKTAGFAGIGKDRGISGKGAVGREPRSMGDKSRAWFLGMRWGMVEQE